MVKGTVSHGGKARLRGPKPLLTASTARKQRAMTPGCPVPSPSVQTWIQARVGATHSGWALSILPVSGALFPRQF